jgi:UDP-GlcNAc:undecaprenyl-phosphate GlcNAc-1-phosphate transferase
MELLPLILGVVVSLATAVVMVPTMVHLGHRYQFLDMPGRHKRHKRPTPILGGVALFLSVWTTVLVCLVAFPHLFAELAPSLLYVMFGALIILLVGLSDDLAPLSAWVKLLAQVAAGLVLYVGGLKVVLISTPFGSIEIGGLSVLLTVLWVVGLANAVNLIDGLDGLAAGVSLIGAATMLIIGHLWQVGPVLIFMAALVGFLALFLRYNTYPARIFLGDSGSMQLGYYFAVFSLVVPFKSYTAAALYVPLLALGVPILETLSSAVRRIFAGRRVWQADRRHLFHYLALMGLSPRQVVIVFYALAVVFGGFALAMFLWNRLLVFGFLVVFMVVIFTAFFILLTNFIPRRKGGLGSGFGQRGGGDE